jgi:UDP-glucose 4-epimerase
VLEVIEACRRVTGHPIPAKIEARRPGDPALLIADSSRAQKTLNWYPKYIDVQSIIETAWQWHSTHPLGYKTPSK